MFRCFLSVAAAAAFALVLPATAADQADSNPMTSPAKQTYSQAKSLITRAADKMSDADYAFKPTPDVRSYAQLMGHVANSQFMFCASALGEKSPSGADIEKTKTTKADVVAALKDAFAYCDKAYDSLTDASAAEKVKFFGQERSRMWVLSFNLNHDFEHYGNAVTYLRLKNVVPPSSEGKK
jgi:uncharacterized damage-inducible protein DinB